MPEYYLSEVFTQLGHRLEQNILRTNKKIKIGLNMSLHTLHLQRVSVTLQHGPSTLFLEWRVFPCYWIFPFHVIKFKMPDVLHHSPNH